MDVGTAGSFPDAQLFNTCHMKQKFDDGSIGFPDPAPITQGGRDVPCFILADDAFSLKTWLMKPYGKRMLTREEMVANYRISRGRRVVEKAFGILVSRFKVMMTTIELPPAKSEGCGLHLCGSAQHTEKPVSRSAWWSTAFSGLPNIPKTINQLCLFQMTQPFANISPPTNKHINPMPNISPPTNKQTNRQTQCQT